MSHLFKKKNKLFYKSLKILIVSLILTFFYYGYNNYFIATTLHISNIQAEIIMRLYKIIPVIILLSLLADTSHTQSQNIAPITENTDQQNNDKNDKAQQDSQKTLCYSDEYKLDNNSLVFNESKKKFVWNSIDLTLAPEQFMRFKKDSISYSFNTEYQKTFKKV